MVLPVFVLVWFIGDFVYSRAIVVRHRRWEVSILRDADGVREGAREFTVGDGETALLMIHGFGDSPAIFRLLAEDLAVRGYTCRAMRLPGAGEPVEAAGRAGREDWFRAIEAELGALRATHPRAWILGHSLGAALGIEYAVAHPGAVDGLVLVAPMIAVSNRRSPVLPARLWFAIGSRLLLFSRVWEDYLPINGHGAAASTYRMDDRYFARSTYQELFRTESSVRRLAGHVHVPLMMVISQADQVTDARAALRFFEDCRAEPKHLMVAGNSGHVIPIEPDWPEVSEGIAWFVSSASP